MSIRYTKKDIKNTADERTVPTEEFINLMVSSKRMPDKLVEKPRIESKK